MWAAWEVGAWQVLRDRFTPDLIVGASAGSWIGWALAGGATTEELTNEWTNGATGKIMQVGLHSTGFLRGDPLMQAARELFDRYQPRVHFALTIVELPSLSVHIVRDREITWRHLAASCAIPFGFPPVEIDGRRYVDGGLRSGLPIWVAEELGATNVLALNVLSTPGFRLLRRVMRVKRHSPNLKLTVLEPSERLGTVRDSIVWNATKVERWIQLGQHDAKDLQ
jgi:NTE family protein